MTCCFKAIQLPPVPLRNSTLYAKVIKVSFRAVKLLLKFSSGKISTVHQRGSLVVTHPYFSPHWSQPLFLWPLLTMLPSICHQLNVSIFYYSKASSPLQENIRSSRLKNRFQCPKHAGKIIVSFPTNPLNIGIFSPRSSPWTSDCRLRSLNTLSGHFAAILRLLS